MTSQPTARELTELLADRYELFATLAEEPATQASLSDRRDVSRPTVHRVMKAFQEHNLVQRVDDRYGLTEFGEAVLESHEEYLATMERLTRLERMERELGDGITLESPILEGAEPLINDSNSIDSGSYEYRPYFQRAVRVNTVLDGIMFDYLNSHKQNTASDEVKMIVPDELAETLMETYEEPVQTLLDRGYFELYRTSKPVPHSVTVVETPDQSHAIVLKHDEGRLIGSVRNSSAEALSWAQDRFDEYLSDAERIQPDGTA